MKVDSLNSLGPNAGNSTNPDHQSPARVNNPTEHYATQLRDSTISLFMFGSLGGTFKDIDMVAYRMFRDRLLFDCGSPTDPIEIMIIEQLALAHLNVGQLHYKAANAGSTECAGIYLAAGARLMGEFRRSALALKEYRGPQGKSVKNTATVGHDETAAALKPEGETEEKRADSKLGANEGDQEHEDATIRFRRPTTIRDGKAEPPEVARVHGRRAPTAARSRRGEQAVAVCNGAENRGGQGAICS